MWRVIWNTHSEWGHKTCHEYPTKEEAQVWYNELKESERQHLLDEIELIPPKHEILREFLLKTVVGKIYPSTLSVKPMWYVRLCITDEELITSIKSKIGFIELEGEE